MLSTASSLIGADAFNKQFELAVEDLVDRVGESLR